MNILDEKTLKSQLSIQYLLNKFEPLSSETYNEELIVKKMQSYGDDARHLFYCALQIAIVGSGNKSWGSYRFDGKEHVLTEVFSRFKVKHNQSEKC